LIFVDSSFWIAAGVPRDGRHAEAVLLRATYGEAPLLTTNHVRGETWTFLRRRVGHWAAVDFVGRLDSAQGLRVEFISEALEREALEWLRRHDEREYSFVDATSFAVMRRLRIREALAFDGDFAAAGFVELRA
jgi:uncharacterized protein